MFCSWVSNVGLTVEHSFADFWYFLPFCTGVAATTREFVDVVLGELLRARRDVEYFMESPA